MITLTFAELNDLIPDNMTNENDEPDSSICLAGTLWSTTRAVYGIFGMTWDDVAVTFNPMMIHKIQYLHNAFHEEYEGSQSDAKYKMWELFDLGGDDSIDYESGHPSILVDALADYCTQHKILHTVASIILAPTPGLVSDNYLGFDVWNENTVCVDLTKADAAKYHNVAMFDRIVAYCAERSIAFA